MEKQEYLLRLGMLQQEAERLSQENQSIDKQINELQNLRINLESFLSSKSSDSLISLGNGIYTNAELKGKDLWVNIGANTVVKKSVPETAKIIDEQIAKLEKLKEQLSHEMDLLNVQLNGLVESARQLEENEQS